VRQLEIKRCRRAPSQRISALDAEPTIAEEKPKHTPESVATKVIKALLKFSLKDKKQILNLVKLTPMSKQNEVQPSALEINSGANQTGTVDRSEPIILPKSRTLEEANENKRRIYCNGSLLFTIGQWLCRHHPSGQTVTNILLIAVTAILAGIAYRQYVFSETAERAYIAFGSKDGSLAEFREPIDDKPVIELHFFNSGLSEARHFSVQVHTNAAGSTYSFNQRHRTEGPYGGIMTSGVGGEYSLGAGAESIFYVTDPKQLWTSKELKNPKGWFSLEGQIEYCDIFGGYHCELFSAEYSPIVHDFVPGSNLLECIRGNIDPRALHGIEMGRPATFVEIPPCEQPSEPEYRQQPIAPR
jgi:hypothetical protein